MPGHDEYMAMAVAEARKSVPEPGQSRPRVGAVVVLPNGSILTGHRGELSSGEHAEYTVLEKKGADQVLADATVYTTLEPCTTRNHPKVPCVDRLIERKVARVVIGMVDPNPMISGRGISRLREANISVDMFSAQYAKEVEEINRDFIRAQKEQVTAPEPDPALLGDLRARVPAEGNRTTIRAFKDAEAYMDDVYALYRSLYDLPELQHEEQLSDRYLFKYCEDRRYFVNILPYTKNRQVLLTPTFQGHNLGWRIIGGAVEASFDEAFVKVCQRHVERYVESVDLGEIEPVAFLKNRFKFGAKVHDHLGILFVARVRNYDDRSLRDRLPSSRGHFVPFDLEGAAPRLDEIYQAQAFELGVAVADKALQFVNQDHEIDTNQMYRSRYKFHEIVVKPLMRGGSKIFGKTSISAFDDQVRREILDSSPSSVFDIACGENRSLVNLVKKREASTFVGNDISWSQIELVSGSFDADTFRNNQGIVFFTNHDGRRLPFADKAFDVGVCKNVLHHMPDRRSATALLRELKRVSKKALIVEVMDPKFEGGRWPRLRHSYYINFLKDAGGNFLSGDEFNSLIEEFSPRSRYDVRTIRGVYQFAIF